MKDWSNSEIGQRGIWLQAIVVCLIAIATRIPFQSHILHEFDSVNFALALERFDIRLHQPHPPGMFFFFIAIGRGFNAVLHDANASLVWVSTLAAGFAASASFLLGTHWFGRYVGWVIAALLITSPLVWFQGEVALSYMLEFLWVLLIVTSCDRLRRGNPVALFTAAALIGLAGGIRPNTLFFLFPLWLAAVGLSLRERKYSIWQPAVALVVMVLSTGFWLVPMVMLSGGPAAAWDAMQPWLNRHPKDGLGRGFDGIFLNTKILLTAIAFGMGFSLLPAIWVGWKQRKWLKSLLRYDWRAQALLIWLIPGLTYLIFVHMQRMGHAFTIMPALIIVGGVAIAQASRHLQARWRKAHVLLPLLVCVGNVLLFLGGPGQLDNIPTWATIRNYDTYISERLTAIRNPCGICKAARFPPSETMVLTRGRNSGIRDFYLRDYQGSSRLTSVGEAPTVVSSPINTLVLFDDNVLRNVAEASGFQPLALPTQGRLRYLRWSDNQQAQVSRSSFQLQPRQK